MKRATVIVVLLCITVGLPLSARARQPDNFMEKKFLISLFPGSSLATFKSVLGRDSASDVVCNVTLKGMKGFIPTEKAKSLKLTALLSVITFPIYLHEANLSQDRLIEVAPDEEPTKIKLVQVIFYNHDNGQLYGKPPSFPLKSTGWACGGDLCDNVEIVGLESIGNSSTAVVFKYTEGVSSHKLRVLVVDGTEVKLSEVFQYGELGGESGISASTEYTGWDQTGGTVTATRNSICDRHEEEFCRSVGLVPGRSSARVLMLDMDSRR